MLWGGALGHLGRGKQAGVFRAVCKGHSKPLIRCPFLFLVKATVAFAATQVAAPPCGGPEQNWPLLKSGSYKCLFSPTVRLQEADSWQDFILPADPAS